MGSLDGRVIVITGAAGGLGRAYATLFAQEGAKIVANDIADATGLEQLVHEIREVGGEIVPHGGDISDERDADELLTRSLDTFGRVDVLVNNAGTFREGSILDSSAEDWDAQMRVHLRGHFLATRAAGWHWRARRRNGGAVHASVVNTTSRSALNAIEGHAVYGAAKAGIITFTLIAAKELAEYGVRVNCVAPFARTAMTSGITTLAGSMPRPPDGFDRFDPANVAPLVGYLATRDCPLSGQVLFCHGGTVQRYEPWRAGPILANDTAWTIDDLAGRVPRLGEDDHRQS